MEDILRQLVEWYNHKPINITEIDPSFRYPDVYTEYQADEILYAEAVNQQVIYHCKNGIQLKLDVISETMIQLRYAPKGRFTGDHSYAVDPSFEASTVKIKLEETKTFYTVSTSKVQVKVMKKGMLVHFLDNKGVPICEESKGFYARSTLMKGWTDIKLHKKKQEGESYFGLGDKSCSLKLNGRQFLNWNTDSFAYGPDTDPLYRAIPFYYGLHEGRSYGIFLDNTYRTRFDFGKTDPETSSFGTEGGELNYYFIYGPAMMDVAKQYIQLTGKPELPPMWALGFHQCRWSYFPDVRVKEIARLFREKEIPCDAIYLDIDYMDGYRCFTWNKNYFPKPKKMIKELKEEGFKTVVMIDPGIRTDPEYHVYKDGVEKDVFCRRPNGEEMNGPVWPPDCAWPDFTDPGVRQWWGPLYKKLYDDEGVSGFWNDMNEPAVFGVDNKTFPDQVNHFCDGQPGDHHKAHNIYGLTMSQATYEGLKKLKPNTRPFVLTRATYSGGQRFSSVWTGDNVASWEHLQIANRQCQRLSISGFSFVGTDIGGFVGVPTGELMVRWLQLGIFHPFYRIHSIGNNTDGATSVDEEEVAKEMAKNRLDQEPWAFGEDFEKLNKKAIEFRYQLLPYIYTAFRQHIKDGYPILRPLSMYDQTDKKAIKNENEFIFGDQLLVAPVTKEGKTKIKAYLPQGSWYHFQSKQLFKGSSKAKVKAPLSEIPLFVKAGSVLPLYPVRQHTAQPITQLNLNVYYAEGTHQSQLYEDAGEGYGYTKKEFSWQKFKVEASENQLKLSRQVEGKMKVSYPTIQLQLIGLPFKITSCLVDGETIELKKGEDSPTLQLKSSFKQLEIKG